MTTHAPSEIIRELLISLNLFESPSDCDAWPIYKSFMPDGGEVPGNVGVVYDTTGVKDGRLMEGPLVLHPGFQLAVRASTHPEGWAQCKVVEAAFEAVTSAVVTLESSVYTIKNISQVAPIFFVGQETNTTIRRWLFTINFLMTVSEA